MKAAATLQATPDGGRTADSILAAAALFGSSNSNADGILEPAGEDHTSTSQTHGEPPAVSDSVVRQIVFVAYRGQDGSPGAVGQAGTDGADGIQTWILGVKVDNGAGADGANATTDGGPGDRGGDGTDGRAASAVLKCTQRALYTSNSCSLAGAVITGLDGGAQELRPSASHE